MNNTTTASPPSNATITFPLDYYYAMFVNTVVVIRLYQIGYPITFILGFVGNIASLITFSRLSLRRVSTGCLFIVLAVSDTFFLLMCIFDFVEFGLQVLFIVVPLSNTTDCISPHRCRSIITCRTMSSVDFVRSSWMSLKCYPAGHWWLYRSTGGFVLDFHSNPFQSAHRRRPYASWPSCLPLTSVSTRTC